MLGKKLKVAILTPAFTEFGSGYSLTGIVKDQALMLTRHGHEVDIFVSDGFNFNAPGYNPPPGVKLVPKLPFARLVDYNREEDFGTIWPEAENFSEDDKAVHRACPLNTSNILLQHMPEYDRVFTHDWLLTGWKLPYYMGLRAVAANPALQDVRWLHWVHSTPTHGFNWWDLSDLGKGHKLVFPNKSYQLLPAEAFKTTTENVVVIPHPKDLRIWKHFTPDACAFIDRYQGVMQADIVQIYPASVDRLEHKRVREVILIFKYIKLMGFKVCLVIANQWATGTQEKEDVAEYKTLGLNNGLGFQELIFTSEFKPEWEVGVPEDVLENLSACGNLFIFPTISETFGLVLPEAILSGGVLPVINSDLDVLSEITGLRGLRFPFGSFNRQVHYGEGEANYMRAVAATIVDRMMSEESLAAKTYVRQTLNIDSLYHRYYQPIMEGAIAW
jgi:hypothetical protein